MKLVPKNITQPTFCTIFDKLFSRTKNTSFDFAFNLIHI
jgi:hypothetical protein